MNQKASKLCGQCYCLTKLPTLYCWLEVTDRIITRGGKFLVIYLSQAVILRVSSNICTLFCLFIFFLNKKKNKKHTQQQQKVQAKASECFREMFSQIRREKKLQSAFIPWLLLLILSPIHPKKCYEIFFGICANVSQLHILRSHTTLKKRKRQSSKASSWRSFLQWVLGWLRHTDHIKSNRFGSEYDNPR